MELEDAQQTILSKIPPFRSENICLSEAYHRILATDLFSPIDLPAFDNSAMDGYAVRAADLATANPNAPVELRRIGEAAAGQPFAGEVQPHSCVRVFTGSPLPRGADAVVMQEDTHCSGNSSGLVTFLEWVGPWENVRLRGADIKQGVRITKAGERLTVGQINLLAASGFTQVEVGKQPVMGIIATGSELREPGRPLGCGEIYESNRVALGVLLRLSGAQTRFYSILSDHLHETQAALEGAFAECDAVVTTGGVSVGDFDFLKAGFAALGGELDFWKVAIKPGKPFCFGNWKDKFLFGLPGNPVSAFITCLMLVRPAVLRWQGASQLCLPSCRGVLTQSLVNRGDRRHFMRVIIDAEGQVKSAGTQASHMLSSLALADGIVDVAPNTTLALGTTVRVLQWE